MDTAFNHLVRRLQNQISGSLNVTEINPLVFSLELLDHHLVIYYYLPGAVRVLPADIGSTEKGRIHLDEDVWLNKSDLVLNRILSRVRQVQRVYAREGIVARIDKKTAIAFLEEHHLHTPMPGKYRYGLFVDGELMSVGIFSGARVMRHTENYRSFECIRFCTKQGYVVVGGLSKLLKTFYRNFKPSDVMTYVDYDWSDGSNYEKIGFKKAGFLAPQYYLVDLVSHQRTPYKPASVGPFEIEKNKGCYLVANSGSLKMIKPYLD